jgi:hypothetical protein
MSLVPRLFYGAIALLCGIAGAYAGFRFTIYAVGIPIALAYPHDGQNGLAVGMIAFAVAPVAGIAVSILVFMGLRDWHGNNGLEWDE